MALRGQQSWDWDSSPFLQKGEDEGPEQNNDLPC